MTSRCSQGFTYHCHKFKDLAPIRGFQTRFSLFCFSRGTICKMKVYVGSLYKREMRGCWGWSWPSRFLTLLPSPFHLRTAGSLQPTWNLFWESFSKGTPAQTDFEVAEDPCPSPGTLRDTSGWSRLHSRQCQTFVTLGKSSPLYRWGW